MKHASRAVTIATFAAGIVLVAAAARSWSVAPGAAPMKYVAKMTGPSEVPANTEKGTGTASFTMDGTNVTYTITVADLTGPATAAHIHIGGPTVAGGVAYGFKVTAAASGTIATGTIDLTKPASATVSGDSLKALFNNGNAYVNVHTAAHPGGEIRGQVAKRGM
jgi:Cu/Zn superoxide dismutase